MSKYGDNCPACKACKKENRCDRYTRCVAFRSWFMKAWDEIRLVAGGLKNDKKES